MFGVGGKRGREEEEADNDLQDELLQNLKRNIHLAKIEHEIKAAPKTKQSITSFFQVAQPVVEDEKIYISDDEDEDDEDDDEDEGGLPVEEDEDESEEAVDKDNLVVTLPFEDKIRRKVVTSLENTNEDL